MKNQFFIPIIFLILSIFLSSANAQFKGQTINDSVLKIKSDDDGKLFVMAKGLPILYLRYSNPNFDSLLTTLSNSQAFNSTIKVTTDSQFNILKAE